jgi:hypothetical protein
MVDSRELSFSGRWLRLRGMFLTVSLKAVEMKSVGGGLRETETTAIVWQDPEVENPKRASGSVRLNPPDVGYGLPRCEKPRSRSAVARRLLGSFLYSELLPEIAACRDESQVAAVPYETARR